MFRLITQFLFFLFTFFIFLSFSARVFTILFLSGKNMYLHLNALYHKSQSVKGSNSLIGISFNHCYLPFNAATELILSVRSFLRILFHFYTRNLI